MLSRSTVTVLTLLVAGIAARPEPPLQQYLPPNQLYGAPQGARPPPPAQSGSGQFGGVPQYLPPNQQYGPPGAGGGLGGYGDDANNGPAQYMFEYMVNDPATNNDFGHKENRDGEMTRGVYFVLLPDGRRQTVEYEVDQFGYRPKITYSQEGPGYGSGNAGGYPGSGGYPGGSGGYPGGSGGYPSGSGGYRY